MRILVTGARGLLGAEVVAAMRSASHEVLDFGREFDVSDPMSVGRIASGEFAPLDWVVNCAAYTAVDTAEKERRDAYEVNALGAAYLGQTCSMAHVKLLHISTDFVFDGMQERPYCETDAPHPLGVYGQTKLEGELALAHNPLAVVVRTSWLFGPRGKCFPSSILNAHALGKRLRVVSDQFGTPTYTPDLARCLVDLVAANPFPDLYHLSGPDVVSWHEFARRTLVGAGQGDAVVEPISTADWQSDAVRPRYSALNSSKAAALGFGPMPRLDHAIERFLKSRGESLESA